MVWQLVRRLGYTMFIRNNGSSFHMCWKENLVKLQKVSKYYETDSLHIFLLIFMFLLTTNFVKNSHISARIVFIFLIGVLNRTWNAFNTKFLCRGKDCKSTYEVRAAFTFFVNLIALNLVWNIVKKLGFIKIVEGIKFEGVWDELESKHSF